MSEEKRFLPKNDNFAVTSGLTDDVVLLKLKINRCTSYCRDGALMFSLSLKDAGELINELYEVLNSVKDRLISKEELKKLGNLK